MNMNKLTGGAAVGAAIVVFFAHGKDFTPEEIVAMSAGVGTAINYVVNLVELLTLGAADKLKFDNTVGAEK